MKKTGTIEALNVSPKGFYEGFLLKAGKKIVQVNLPKDQIHLFGERLKPGSQVTVEVEAEEERGEPAHAVFQLLKLKGLAGEPDDSFSGIVETLNYALHGEVNGGILDSGDFLHLKPEGARAVGLTQGMYVEGHGGRRPKVGGGFVIEADDVNGAALGHHKAKKKHGPKHSPKH